MSEVKVYFGNEPIKGRKETGTQNYGELLKLPEWIRKRKLIIKRDGNQCVNCHSDSPLEVHHRQYHVYQKTGSFKRPWDYPNKYLITLCSVCHRAGHHKFNVPIFHI